MNSHGMIITRLAGGLGNQMFHYAIARNYSNNGNNKIYFDTYMLWKEEEDIEKIFRGRPYALDIFGNLKAKVNDKKVSSLLRGNGWADRVRQKLLFRNCVVVEQHLMDPITVPAGLEKAKNIWFIGNFQSEKHFKAVRSDLLKDFKFPALDARNEDLRKRMLNTANAVAIHVRRGDYLSSHNKSIFPSVSFDYYAKATALLLQKLGMQKMDAFVFTDDAEWTKAHFSGLSNVNATYVNGNKSKDSWKDMALMAACQHHIIANSSFSWWGAWLATKSGINLAPKHWYLPGSLSFDIYDIVPKGWLIVDYSI